MFYTILKTQVWDARARLPHKTLHESAAIACPKAQAHSLASAEPVRRKEAAAKRRPGDYVFIFGRHYGKPIREVLCRAPSCIAWLVDTEVHRQRWHRAVREALVAIEVL